MGLPHSVTQVFADAGQAVRFMTRPSQDRYANQIKLSMLGDGWLQRKTPPSAILLPLLLGLTRSHDPKSGLSHAPTPRHSGLPHHGSSCCQI